MFDIDSIQDLQTAEVQLHHPITGAPLDAWITLMGPENPGRREVDFDHARAVRKRLMEGAADEMTADESSAEQIAYLAACTAGWRGITRDGQEMPYSQEAARDIYTRAGWMREQASRAMGRRDLFIGGSANASSTGPENKSA